MTSIISTDSDVETLEVQQPSALWYGLCALLLFGYVVLLISGCIGLAKLTRNAKLKKTKKDQFLVVSMWLSWIGTWISGLVAIIFCMFFNIDELFGKIKYGSDNADDVDDVDDAGNE
ncbi:hypothetical protein OAM67_01830 [bacterium]|nr:hypothetical protein [bacterium]